MRKCVLLFILMSIALLCGCNSADNALPIAGYDTLSMKLSETSVSTEQGVTAYSCYINAYGQETCEYTDSGATGSGLYIDPQIKASIQSCDSETLALRIVPELPEYHASEYVWCRADEARFICDDGRVVSYEEAVDNNKKVFAAVSEYQKTRRTKVIHELADNNPGLLSDNTIEQYIESSDPVLVKLPACQFDDFVQKNENHLKIIEFIANVQNPAAPKACETEEISPVLLLRASGSQGPSDIQIFQVLDSKEMLSSTISGIQSYAFSTDIQLDQATIDNIDFEQNTVILVTSMSEIQHDPICKGSPLEFYSTNCVGMPVNASAMYYWLIIALPKAEYSTSYSVREAICE